MKTILLFITHFKRGKLIALLLTAMLLCSTTRAQVPVPFTIENNSLYPDHEVFVAVVGEDLAEPSNHMWIDAQTGAQLPMSSSYNTIKGPVYDGNQGPGQNAMYADCFTRLSDIPDKTITIPAIQGCRIFISYKEQLYFYFFSASGDPKGYTSPSYTDPTDPNQGIEYEIIELTNDGHGLFANPTRVDSYRYPIGLELYGGNGYYKKVGEIATHEEIIAAYQASVPVEFQKCFDPETEEIVAPAKTPEFADGSIGTMPDLGEYVDYMKPYVDAVWEKYANEDLIFDAGDAGIWKGRVQGEELVMVSQSTAFMGRKAIISRRPTTQEVFEGKGVLDNVVQDKDPDLLVQAQICAALNRHVIDVTTPNVGLQDWSDASDYYQQDPCNHYAKFWHQQGISVDQLSYGFAYDDVWEYSSSVHSPNPTKAIIHLGPYTEDTNDGVIIPAVIQAENYTDMSGIQLEGTSDDGGGTNVGWIDTGDWLEYEINAPEAGEYTVNYRVASLNAGGTVDFFANGVSKGVTSFSATGGWQNWITKSATVNLSAGNQTIRLIANSSGWNINWMEFTTSGTPPDGDECNVAVNSDFSVEISDDASNPSLTFVPERSGVGTPTCILYYSTSPDGTYPGYLVSANSPYQISASVGQTIYFYYTYSLPEGGENNTLNNKKSFVVGQCNSGSSARMGSESSVNENNVNFTKLVLFPNPANNKLTITGLSEEVTEVRVYDITGKDKLVIRPKTQEITMNIQHLMAGLHFVRIQTKSDVVTRSFIKK